MPSLPKALGAGFTFETVLGSHGISFCDSLYFSVARRSATHILALKNLSNTFECWVQIPFRKADVGQAMNVGKLGATLFQEDDGARKSKPALKQPCFMNDIFTGVVAAIGMNVLGRHHQESKARLVEALLETRYCSLTRCGFGIKFITCQMQAVAQKRFKLVPNRGAAVANEDFFTHVFHWVLRTRLQSKSGLRLIQQC